jgi:hypothetical protein
MCQSFILHMGKLTQTNKGIIALNANALSSFADMFHSMIAMAIRATTIKVDSSPII